MGRNFTGRFVSAAFVLLLIAILPAHAFAWGRKGHQIVAGIAERFLTAHSPQTLARAKQLLGGQSLVDVATFADDVRNRREYTKNWHFVDIPLNEDNFDPARDCVMTNKGDCAVLALTRFAFVLRDNTEDPCVRAEALRFIVHIIGDMHQPLHNVNDNDAGGNGKIVRFFTLQGFNGGPPNLHEVWDDGIIDKSGLSVAQLVAQLTPPNDNGNISMEPSVWVKEAHVLAQDAYRRLPQPNASHVFILDNDSTYFDKGLPVVRSQLQKAGLRLAKALKVALG